MRKQTAFVLALVAALLGGAVFLAWQALSPQEPAATPMPQEQFTVHGEDLVAVRESIALDPAWDVEPLVIPDDAVLSEYVRTDPVEEPPVEPSPGPGTPAAPSAGGPNGQTPVPAAPTAPTQTPAPTRPAPDPDWTDRLQVPSLYIDAHVRAMGTDNSNHMLLPDSLHEIGLLRSQPALSAEEGTTIIAGHVTLNGIGGAMYYLGQVQPGARVRTWDEAGERQEWVVTTVEVIHQQSLPRGLFTKTGERRLVLITCGGEQFQRPDGRWSFDHNIVVTAVPVSS